MKFFFAPHYPDKEPYLLTVILHILDYEVTRNPQDTFDVASLWEDETFVEVPQSLQNIGGTMPVINLRCTDISKERVEQAFVKVFGYSSLVDPSKYRGLCVKKPDLNAVRYGYVVDCPIDKAEDGFVYQKLVDARPDEYQREFRTPVIFGKIPAVYVSKRDYPVDDLKQQKRHQLTPSKTEDIYTPEEINQIAQFCDEIGMDFGELDILRDKHDGRLYILDANKTPAGYGLENRSCWSPGDRKRMAALMAEAFERGLKKRIAEHNAA